MEVSDFIEIEKMVNGKWIKVKLKVTDGRVFLPKGTYQNLKWHFIDDNKGEIMR